MHKHNSEVQRVIQSALQERNYELEELINHVCTEIGMGRVDAAKAIWRLVDARLIDVTPDRKMGRRPPN